MTARVAFDYCPTNFGGDEDAEKGAEQVKGAGRPETSPSTGPAQTETPPSPARETSAPEAPAATQTLPPQKPATQTSSAQTSPTQAPSGPTPSPQVEAVKPEPKKPESQGASRQAPTSEAAAREEKTTHKTSAFEFPLASALFGTSSEFASLTASRLSVHMLDAAQANFNASFEFAKQVAAAKDLGEVLRLQTAYLQQQFASVTAQTEEMAEFAQKFSALKSLKRA